MKTCVYTHAHAHTHTHSMEYYSAIKKNEIMPLAATRMGYHMKWSKKDKYDSTFKSDIKEYKNNSTNELIQKTELDPQT